MKVWVSQFGVVLASALAIVCAGAPAAYAQGSDPGYVPTGEIVADSGFRPTKDGFSFENYGNENDPANLGTEEMIDLFGKGVCASEVNGGTCRLTRVATEWMEKTNDEMHIGHCFGFAAFSLALFRNQVPAGRRGDLPAGAPFGFPNTVALQRDIAYAWTWQTTAEVREHGFISNPKRVLNRLIKDLGSKTDTVTLLFWNRSLDAGHAITPYAVESKGDGKYEILSYDNNYPGKTTAFHVDTVANTWNYDLASLNPGQEPYVWEGDAKTNTTFLASTNRGLGRHKCPFCAKSKEHTNEITLDGAPLNHPHLLITDSEGNRVGYDGGAEPVNEIPGAQILPQATDDPTEDKPEPRYLIPSDAGDVDIRIDGRSLAKPTTSDLTVVGPGNFAEVDRIETARDEVEHMTVGRNVDSVHYETGRTESPNISLGFDDRSGVSWSFSALASGVRGGSAVTFKVNPKAGTLRFRNERGRGKYSLAAFRDSRRSSLDWGAGFKLLGKVNGLVHFNQRRVDDNGKPGLPIRWTYDGGSSTDTLDRDYQDK